jgi:hypothetical protein
MPDLTAIKHNLKRLASLAVTFCALLCVLHAAPACALEQVVSVPVADNASISYLLTQKDGSHPGWILVMFAGGDGALQLAQASDGTISLRLKNNFLVRARVGPARRLLGHVSSVATSRAGCGPRRSRLAYPLPNSQAGARRHEPRDDFLGVPGACSARCLGRCDPHLDAKQSGTWPGAAASRLQLRRDPCTAALRSSRRRWLLSMFVQRCEAYCGWRSRSDRGKWRKRARQPMRGDGASRFLWSG